MTNVPCHCDNCGEEYNPANTFFIFDPVMVVGVDDSQSFCESCGDDLKDEMKADGWIRDDDDECGEPMTQSDIDEFKMEIEELKAKVENLEQNEIVREAYISELKENCKGYIGFVRIQEGVQDGD